MKLTIFLLIVGIIAWLVVFPILLLVQSAPAAYPDQEFLGGFHTGTCLWDAYTPNSTAFDVWTPARVAGVLKLGSADERGVIIHENGSVSDVYFGAECGPWTEESIGSKIESYLNMNIVPIMVFSRIFNFENLSETAVENFLAKIAGWVDAVDPAKFVIWNPVAENNFPDGMEGWRNGTQKIDFRDFVPQIKMIRRVRDELGLQNKMVIGIQANLLTSYQSADGGWHFQGWDEYTGFKGIDEYVEGFAQADVFGVSHYLGYKDPESNPCNLTWQQTLQKSWKRSRIIWQKVCKNASRLLPFYFFEYSLGSASENPIWKEAVTYTYTQMVHNNKWVKGLNWYTGAYFEPDAMQELVSLASEFDGYGFPPSLVGDANGDDIVDRLDLVIVNAALGSEAGDLRWNPIADLRSDGLVDIFDLQRVGKVFGETTRVFCDGFEDGGFGAFTGTITMGGGALECQSSVKRFGDYAAHAYAASSAWSDRAIVYLDTSQTLSDAHYVRMYIRFAALPDTHGDYADFVRVRGTDPYPTTIWRCDLSYITDRCYLEMYTPHGSSSFLYCDFSDINATKWYVVEFGYRKHATEGFYRIYVDGVLEASDENRDTSSDLDAANFRFGLVGGAGTWGSGLPNVYLDLVAIDTEYIGPAVTYE
jgi:hypothetical protein